MFKSTPPTPQDSVFWYTLQKPIIKKLNQNLTADALVIGGGMAGLTTAQQLKNKGLSVIIAEQDFCGSGASGKSSGFITPDSELGLRDFAYYFGEEKAERIWQLGINGVNFIKKNIETYSINCQYQVQDSLFVANSRWSNKYIQEEYESQSSSGRPITHYTKEMLPSIVSTDSYYSGIRYGNTFGMSAYIYCQTMRETLEKQGITIVEDCYIEKINGNIAHTKEHTIQAKHIIICADRFLPHFNILPSNVYHAQTFIALTKPMNESAIKKIFPQDQLMVWDTDLIYQYYRIIGGNRFLIGGGSLLNTYDKTENHHAQRIFKKLYTYISKRFPHVTFDFEYMWPGLIGISKDLIPYAGRVKDQPHIYYITAAAGLPWAAALGQYITEKIVDNRSDFDDVFSQERKQVISPLLQKILGLRLTFAMSNGISKFFG